MSTAPPTQAERSADLHVGLAMASVGFYTSGMGAVLASLAVEFGVPAESLSWVGSVYGFGLILVALLGRFALKLGPSRALLLSVVGLGIGAALTAFGPHLITVFCGSVLQGVSSAAVILIAPVMLIRNADLRLTRVNAISSLVGISAPLLVGAAAAIGAPGRYTQLLLLPMVIWLAILLWQHSAVVPVVGDQAPPASEHRVARRSVARRWLAVIMAVSVEFSFVVWGVSRLAAAGIDTGVAAAVGVAFPVGMTVGRLIGPTLIKNLPAITFGVVLAGIGTALIVFTTSWPSVALGLMLAGLGVATMYPVTLAQLMSTAGLAPSHGASAGALASGVAIILAPIALAALATAIDLRWAFLIDFPLLAALWWLHGRQTNRSRPEALQAS